MDPLSIYAHCANRIPLSQIMNSIAMLVQYIRTPKPSTFQPRVRNQFPSQSPLVLPSLHLTQKLFPLPQ